MYPVGRLKKKALGDKHEIGESFWSFGMCKLREKLILVNHAELIANQAELENYARILVSKNKGFQ